MSLPTFLTFKYYKRVMVYKVHLDQLVHLEEMVTIVNLTKRKKKIPRPQGPPGRRNGGVVFIRWGYASCPITNNTHQSYIYRAEYKAHTNFFLLFNMRISPVLYIMFLLEYHI